MLLLSLTFLPLLLVSLHPALLKRTHQSISSFLPPPSFSLFLSMPTATLSQLHTAYSLLAVLLQNNPPRDNELFVLWLLATYPTALWYQWQEDHHC